MSDTGTTVHGNYVYCTVWYCVRVILRHICQKSIYNHLNLAEANTT